MQTGIEIIAAERERQLTAEFYDDAHDDSHDQGELAVSAACYVLAEGARQSEEVARFVDAVWPFGACEFKPSANDRIRELAKAGALCAAEIDRLLRLRAAEARLP